MIVIGADTHKRSHTLAAVDAATGRVLATRTVEADADGMLAAWRWAHALDDERVWAIEDCRHVSGRLERCLVGQGERVVRVPPKLMGASRRGERRPGKSDAIDAVAVARAALREGVDSLPAAVLDEHSLEIRQLCDHRDDLVAERTRQQNRLRWHLVFVVSGACARWASVTGGASLSSQRTYETNGAVMKVFVAGATGALGRELVPQLVARGHEVVGMTRSASKQDLLRSLGARPVVADALDPDAVAQAVASAEPEVIVHQLTALSGKMSAREMRHPDRSVAATMTNRLRTEATDHLLAAGRAVGARRFVAQSFAAFRFARTGGPVQTEADPLDPNPPGALGAVQAGYVHLEQAVTTIEWGEGLALRYGGFYGPGTAISLAPDAVMAAPIRKRLFPIVGDGGGIWSHVHIEDAAAATVAAVERGRPGIYNVVDDEPAPVREWLPVLASALGAKPPRRIPRWLGRLAAGEMATLMMTEARGASNEKAKRELGWQLRYPSWRQGFAQGLG